MTKKELQAQVDELQKQLQTQADELQKQLDVLSEKVDYCNVFPRKDEVYWTYDCPGAVYSTVAYDSKGRLRAYRTEKEAEKARDIDWAKQRVATAIRMLNDGWKPDFTNEEEKKYLFCIREKTRKPAFISKEEANPLFVIKTKVVEIDYWRISNYQPAYMCMKSKDVAQQILDEYKEDLLLIFSE